MKPIAVRTVGSLAALFGFAGCCMLGDWGQDQFGSTILAVQDLDGDGTEEFIVGDDSYPFMRPNSAQRLWILSGSTLECLRTIESADGGLIGRLLGAYSHQAGGESVDRIVTVTPLAESTRLRVFDVVTGRLTGSFDLEPRGFYHSFTGARANDDEWTDLVIGIPGGPSGEEVGGRLQIVDGRTFASIAILRDEDPLVRLGDDVEVLPGRLAGAQDKILASVSRRSGQDTQSWSGAVAIFDPSDWTSRSKLTRLDEDEVELRMLRGSSEAVILLATLTDFGGPGRLESVRSVSREGTELWRMRCEQYALDGQQAASASVVGDRDGDERMDILVAILSLRDAGTGQLYLVSSRGPSMTEVTQELPGLGASMTAARERSTGAVASIAVGACNPVMPFYAGQVVLLDPKDFHLLRSARLCEGNSERVSVKEAGTW